MSLHFGNVGTLQRKGSRYSSGGSIPKRFGNVYAVPPSAKGGGTRMDGNQWERNYGNGWCDVDTFYSWSSNAGNALTTCLKSSNGWRAYRHDRGFQLRLKEEEEEGSVVGLKEFAAEKDFGMKDFADTFAQSFITSALVGFGVGTIKNSLQATSLGAELGLKAIQTSLGFLGSQSGGYKPTSNDLISTAIFTALSMTVARAPINPVAKAFIMPGAFLLQSLLSGKSIGETTASIAGYTLGKGIGGKYAMNLQRPMVNKHNPFQSVGKSLDIGNADIFLGKYKIQSKNKPFQSDLLMKRLKNKKKPKGLL